MQLRMSHWAAIFPIFSRRNTMRPAINPGTGKVKNGNEYVTTNYPPYQVNSIGIDSEVSRKIMFFISLEFYL